MAGYFGTEAQQRLQAQAEASVGFINATPGACQNGRMVGCDDPDRLGWDQIRDILVRDGVISFRLVPREKVGEISARLSEWDCRFDTWDVFLADRAGALAACEPILSKPLPDGLTRLRQPTNPEGEDVRSIQTLMAAAGVVPFSGSLLTAGCGPATTIAIGNEGGSVVAAAHGFMPHNAYSPHHRYAWGGLVAVAQEQRGKGLGSTVNALMIAAVFRDLGATHIYELVSAANIPSRRMVEACGLRAETALVCGVATPNGSARFTR